MQLENVSQSEGDLEQNIHHKTMETVSGFVMLVIDWWGVDEEFTVWSQSSSICSQTTLYNQSSCISAHDDIDQSHENDFIFLTNI